MQCRIKPLSDRLREQMKNTTLLEG